MASKGITRSGEAYCLACHQVVEREAARCEGCLSELTDEVKAFACPKCKTVMALGDPQCPTCGLKFKVRAIRPKEPAKDDQLLMKLIEWGEKGSEKTARPAEDTTAEAQPQRSPAEAERFRKLTDLKESIKELMANRSEMLERMEARLEQQKSRLAQISEAKDSASAAEQIEADIMSLADEMADITMLQAHMDALSDEISSLMESVDVSASVKERGLAARALRKKLESKEREVDELREREQLLIKREEMVDRKIQAYAQKKKQLDDIEEDLKARLSRLEADREELERLKAEAEGARTDSDREAAAAQWEETRKTVARRLLSLRSTIEFHRTGKETTKEEIESAEVDLDEAISHVEQQLGALILEKIEVQTDMQEATLVDEDLRRLLKVLDQMLGQLPEDAIDRFSNSEDFSLYERVLDRFKI
jgi:DNA repair exonuclease SbcCD ATPase subunit